MLKEKLYGIRFDILSERGGVIFEFVYEVRKRFDLEGFDYVKIFVFGGFDFEKIKIFLEVGVDVFGVGSYIFGVFLIDMIMDIKEVDGKFVVKRGRIFGVIENKRLKRVK